MSIKLATRKLIKPFETIIISPLLLELVDVVHLEREESCTSVTSLKQKWSIFFHSIISISKYKSITETITMNQ